MCTEMCRVQIDASLREIEANGFTQFIFIADSGGSRTCEQCKALDGKTFALKDGKVGVNLPPLHPNCRCSIAGHEDDDDFIDWLENHGVELTDDDLKAMGLSRKDDGGKDYPIPRRDDALPLDEKKYYKAPKDEDDLKYKIENSVEPPKDYSRISKTRYRRTDGIEYQNGIYHSNASLIGNTEIKHEMVTETYFIYDKNGGTMIEEKRPKFDYSKYPHDENGKLKTEKVNRSLPKGLDPNSVYDVVTTRGYINRTFTDENG